VTREFARHGGGEYEGVALDDEKQSMRAWFGFAEPFDWRKRSYLGPFLSVFGMLIVGGLFSLAIAAAFKLLGAVVFPGLFDGPKPPVSDTGTTGLGLSAIIVAMIGAPFVVWRALVAQKQVNVAEQGLITDRINKAVEGLGATRTTQIDTPEIDGKRSSTSSSTQPNIEVRVGSVIALERIAKDSPSDAKRILDLLCSYLVHNCSPQTSKQKRLEFNTLREDLGLALQVIYSLVPRFDNGEGFGKRLKIDFRKIDLSSKHILDKKFQLIKFNFADLTHSKFHNCKFKKCLFRVILADKTSFYACTFSRCLFRGSRKLRNASFRKCTFERSGFRYFDLTKTNIKISQLKNTFGDASVTLPNNVDAGHPNWPKGWSKTKLSDSDFRSQWRAFQASIGQDPKNPT
jgi:hypothetical protein